MEKINRSIFSFGDTHSAKQALEISAKVGHNRNNFKQLIYLLKSNNAKEAKMASHVLTYAVKKQSYSMNYTETDQLIGLLKTENLNTSIVRNILAVLENETMITEESYGVLLDLCMNNISNLTLPTAVRLYSISIATRLALPYPEIAQELLVMLSDLHPDEAISINYRKKKAIQSIGKKIQS